MDRWDVLQLHHGSEVLAIHAALLGDGRVVYFSGSEHNSEQFNAGQIDHTRVWDPGTNTVTAVGSPAHDLFCCGHAFLSDGRLLVAGGTKTYDYLGLRESTLLAAAPGPHHNPWTPTHEMARGRWYPTLVTLPDGRVLVVSGALDVLGGGVNTDVEVFDPHAGGWTLVGHQPQIPGGYPRMHLIPDGRVLCVTPMGGMCRAWSPISGGWTDVAPGPGPGFQEWRQTSVLLPLLPQDHYRARVLITGMPHPQILDLGHPDHGWQNTAPRALHDSPFRNHGCTVLLPDGTVAVVAGSKTDADADGVLNTEIFNPATGHWSVGAAATVPRVYHNVALLLADGRVWTAGSNHNGAQGHSEHRVEVYSPDYLDRGPRPTVVMAPSHIRVPIGIPLPMTFEILTPEAASIQSVALLRCGSITHAFDSDQRYVGLE
ncbi:MAG: hypothetical protein LC799_06545, partial [Actinobacteria bacterium]|nr:hypothetical protein [Actinomycetota bacterium]